LREKVRKKAGELFEKGFTFYEAKHSVGEGDFIDVECNNSMIKNEKGDYIAGVSIIRDITERKQAEDKLRDSEERARSLLNAPVDIALLMDNKCTILDCNETFIRRFNKSKDELVGSCALDLFTMEVAKSRKAFFDKLIQTGKTIHFEDQHRGRWFDNFIHPIFDSQGNVTKVAVFARDTTERKQIEERLIEYQNRLRALTSQMTLTEEKERKRFAEYLHDKIGQQLFVLKLKLEGLTKRASSNDTYEDLDNGLKITNQLIKDARSLTFELSPPILYQLGLGAALEWLIEQTEKQYSIMVTFEDDKQEKPLDDDIKIVLFQAVRELLTNIAKHAQAQKAKVSIKRDNSIIRVCVEDDGVGFTPPETILGKGKITGFGLFSIKERLEQLGGNLEIESILGRGTQITLVAPLMSKNRRSNVS
jgi:PAS domain S-box-containing protein